MIDVLGFQSGFLRRVPADRPKTGFPSWFRTLFPRHEAGVRALRDVNVEPSSAQVAFMVWGTAVWRALKLRGVRERDQDDLLQEVFIVAHVNWDRFRGESSRKTWIFGIVHGLVANYHRKKNRAGAEPALVGDEAWCNRSLGGPDAAERRSAARLDLEWLAGVLSTVSELDRSLFVLHCVDGCSVSEAAQIVGVTLSRANGRLLVVQQVVESALSRRQAGDEWRLT